MIDAELALLGQLRHMLRESFEGPAPEALDPPERYRDPLLRLAERLWNNPPFASPLYAGQMIKPPHPVARLAYSLALEVNPNGHAAEGGPATTQMEREAVAQMAELFHWGDLHLGHLTSGGTMANLEALWVASKLTPDGVILASKSAHYTHERISGVLGLPFEAIPVDAHGRMRMDKLKARLQQGQVAAVVATLGTTGVGAVDPLDAILQLARGWGVRVHVDAAYGGYYKLAEAALEESVKQAFRAMPEADSIAVDPHKHGLQPYGCGLILFKDPGVGRFYQHDSPYTYFMEGQVHLGETTLECSRPGAAAAALWATLAEFPLVIDGAFQKGLMSCRKAAERLHGYLEASPDWRAVTAPDLDIVVFAPKAKSASKTSALTRKIVKSAEKLGLHLAQFKLNQADHDPEFDHFDWDEPTVLCLRATLMKWEHNPYIDEIWDLLERARKERV